MGNKIKKSVIITGYACNNNCFFCIDSDKRKFKEKTTKEIKKDIRESKKNGTSYLEFIGGEVTIRRDVLEIISYAKKTGFDNIVMATNGRMLAYPDFARRLVEAGLTEIILSIHGHNNKLHDFLTCSKGSFDQLILGLNNLRDINFKNISANTTIIKQNYKFLPDIGKLLLKNRIKNVEYIFVDPNIGGARNNFYEMVPRISEIAPYVKKTLDMVKSKTAYSWHIRYVPLCFFVGYEENISELNEVEIFDSKHLAPDFINLDINSSRKKIGRKKPKKQCENCILYDKCEGIWVEYIKNYGSEELKAIK